MQKITTDFISIHFDSKETSFETIYNVVQEIRKSCIRPTILIHSQMPLRIAERMKLATEQRIAETLNEAFPIHLNLYYDVPLAAVVTEMEERLNAVAHFIGSGKTPKMVEERTLCELHDITIIAH